MVDSRSQEEGGWTRLAPRLRWFLGAAMVLAAVGYIVCSSMSHALYYFEVDQVIARPDLVGQRMRVRGDVVEDSLRVRRDTLDQHLFLLGYHGATLTVVYSGVLPERFSSGTGVVATGVLVNPDYLEADELTTQCPSRYQAEAPTASSPPADETAATGGFEEDGPGGGSPP